MTDVLSASAPSALAGIEKSLATRRDNAELNAKDGKDFAATFEKVRQQNQDQRAPEEPSAASADPQAASSDPEAAIRSGDGAARSDDLGEQAAEAEDTILADPMAPDAAALAQQLMPLTPPPTQAPAAPVPTDTDPASALAAAVAPRTAAGPTAAALQAMGAGTSALRPDVKTLTQGSGLDEAIAPGRTAPTGVKGAEAGAKPLEAGQFKATTDKPIAEATAFKLDPLGASAPGRDAADTAGAGAGDNPGTAPGAEQALAAATGRERDARAEIVRLDTRLPLHSPRFAEGFGQQVVVLTQHGIQQAQMTLNPPDLGPVDVRITVSQDQASVQIAAASVAAREVIQDALPKLRELMDQSGVRLNDAGVFAQLPQREQPSAHSQRQTWQMEVPGGRRREEIELAQPAVRARRVGLIDAYA